MSKFFDRAAGGAAAGSAFGPWGAAAGGLIGGISSLFGGKSDAERAEEERAQKVEQYRRYLMENRVPEAEASYSQLLGQLQNYKGANDALQKYTGRSVNLTPDFSAKLNQIRQSAQQTKDADISKQFADAEAGRGPKVATPIVGR